MEKNIPSLCPVTFITGAARRIGADITSALHRAGFNVIIHYRHSNTQAEQLAASLNLERPDSAISLQADLNQLDQVVQIAEQAQTQWGRMDALINNASSFYPSPIGQTTDAMWNDLIGSNLKAPFFLAQALAPALRQAYGSIVNIADIYADRPLKQHTLYSIAKAGNVMLTKSLAKELAPQVRVNGIAPGAILWPENKSEDGNTPGDNTADDNTSSATPLSDKTQQAILKQIPLSRVGTPSDISNTILFLLKQAPYITGQIFSVDGGRTLN